MLLRRILQSALILVSGILIVAPSRAQDESETRSIVVSGSAEMQVIPDEAVFMLMIETKDLGIDTALARNEAQWTKLQKLLGEMKINEAQIVADHLDIEPEYLRRGPEYSIGRSSKSYEPEESELHDYTARRRISVTLRDMARYTEFLARVLKLGVELYSTPILRHSNIDELREQMRRKAITNARERATVMAREIGAEIGAPLSISESGWGEGRGGGPGEGMESMYGMAAMYGGRTLPGQINVSSTVNVFFELK